MRNCTGSGGAVAVAKKGRVALTPRTWGEVPAVRGLCRVRLECRAGTATYLLRNYAR